MQFNDMCYYRNRTEAEIRLAGKAAHPKAAAAHYQLAMLYRHRLQPEEKSKSPEDV
jgi:hypothetical protein